MNGTMRASGSQMSIFDGCEPLKADKPIRLIELFAGIGAQAKSLENLGIEFEHYRICEFDKYAVASYNAVHGTNFETSDITKIHSDDLNIVDTDKHYYIMTYSFPCTDLSVAGKQQGMQRGSGTRSGLLWEVERLLKEIVSKGGELPQLLLMENVRDVISDKFIGDFYEWCDFLENIGYTSKYDLLNAKDYGIPQNRERCFMLSWRGETFYDFPETMPLKLRLKDMLEDKVDDKFYISGKMVQYISQSFTDVSKVPVSVIDCGKDVVKQLDIAHALCARDYKGLQSRDESNAVMEAKCEQVGELIDYGTIDQAKRVYSSNGLSPSITAHAADTLPKIEVVGNYSPSNYNATNIVNPKGIAPTVRENHGQVTGVIEQMEIIEPFAYDEQNDRFHTDGTVGTITCDGSSPRHNNRDIVPTNNSKGYDISEDGDMIDVAYPTSTERRGRVQHQLSHTLDTSNNGKVVLNNCRIRKLTPKECWRLMGFTDEDFERAEKVNSNTQLYKQAGNSIVVNVLMEIFRSIVTEI